jgi:tetrahydromethanopterin S-methyltransferase subunit G
MRGNDENIQKELHSLKRRIDEIKQEIIQLETNLQFFGKNQEKNPIVIKVRNDIAKQQERLDELTEKKKLLKQLQRG